MFHLKCKVSNKCHKFWGKIYFQAAVNINVTCLYFCGANCKMENLYYLFSRVSDKFHAFQTAVFLHLLSMVLTEMRDKGSKRLLLHHTLCS